MPRLNENKSCMSTDWSWPDITARIILFFSMQNQTKKKKRWTTMILWQETVMASHPCSARLDRGSIQLDPVRVRLGMARISRAHDHQGIHMIRIGRAHGHQDIHVARIGRAHGHQGIHVVRIGRAHSHLERVNTLQNWYRITTIKDGTMMDLAGIIRMI